MYTYVITDLAGKNSGKEKKYGFSWVSKRTCKLDFSGFL